MWEKWNAYKILIRKYEGQRPLLKESSGTLWYGCVCLRRGSAGRSIKCDEFLDCLRHCQLPKMDSAPWIGLVLRSEMDRATSGNVLPSDVTHCYASCFCTAALPYRLSTVTVTLSALQLSGLNKGTYLFTCIVYRNCNMCAVGWVTCRSDQCTVHVVTQ